MGKPAARVGDQVSPPHAPPILGPGPGSVNVLIGGKPAWRATVDKHACACPIAPPAPAPHGPETCFFGSLSVTINGQMAVRLGDMLIAAGPPNAIVLGQLNVLIGDVGFGLASQANMEEFCADFEQILRDWSGLSPAERSRRLADASNRQLAKSGVPPQAVAGSKSLKAGNAQYSFPVGAIKVSAAQLKSGKLTAKGARSLANNVYHEARHAEQWHLMARRVAAGGGNPLKLGVTQAAAKAARANPLSGASPQSNLAKASYRSVYGKGRTHREAVLKDASKHYKHYRALPEEQDAWNTGDGLPCG